MDKESKIDIKISEEELEWIVGDQIEIVLNSGLKRVHCVKCDEKYDSEMINYEIWMNRLGDIIFEGQCKKCNHKVGRYLEIGEEPQIYKKIMNLRGEKIKTNKDFYWKDS